MPHPIDALFGDDGDVAPITLTEDLARVLNLPQRDAESIGAQIAEPLSKRLRQPGGVMTLRPLQAVALAEAHDLGGLLSPLPVGEGKTLITYLLPVVLGAENPALLLPAGLEDKTRRDFAELEKHWIGPKRYDWVSYELISRRPTLLTELDPDVIICDEADALKNTKAACTRRVRRYLRDRSRAGNPASFYALSGTLTNRSFKDWWHLQQWALPPALHPLPYSFPIVQSWCAALDEKVDAPRAPGELSRFAGNGAASVNEIRAAYGKLLRGVPGVVGCASGSKCDASLRIEYANRSIPIIENALAEMRRTWCTPGGEEFSEASDLWRHAREIANGFYYRWDPPPPKQWLEPRREFHAFVRSILAGSRTLDTMSQVAAAHADDKRVTDWYAIKDTFKPNTVPVWFTDEVIAEAAQDARTFNALVWVEHKAVGERIDLPYFGEGGLDSAGNYIEDHTGPAAVSSIACRRGLNLQHKWSNNIVLNAQPVGRFYEQMFGRTHRFGQPADTVFVRMIFSAQEQRDGFEQARRDAEYIEQVTSQKQKLVFADYL